MTEESREVAEAWERVYAWAGTWDEDEIPDIDLRESLNALVEAVRKDERRRLGVEEGWERPRCCSMT